MRKIALLACVAAVASSAAWAADVTVAGLNAPNGALAVDADTTVLTNGFNATLPSALADAATLWFAADANVIADENGGVTEWRDVREAANAETRLYKAALAYLPEEGEDGYEYRSELPVLTTTNVLPRASAKVVDFGSYGSGRWLYFAAPGGTNLTHVTIGSFFTVIGFDSTCGHILGDVGQLAAGGVGATFGTMFFHKGLGASIGGNIAAGGADNNTMYLGETRLNGTRIDPRIVAYNYNAFQLFSQNGPDRTTRGTPYASTFFNNCNFKPTNGGTLVRQGGGALAEFIAFDRVLSDAERREVEAYLAAKYFGVPVAGRVAVAEGATLAVGFDGLTSNARRAAVISDSCGAGTIRKSGTGALLLERPVGIDATRVDLEAGQFSMGHLHLAPFVAPCINRKYMVGTWWWTSIGARTDGFLSVEGTEYALDAAVSFYPGDWAGRAFIVKGMTGTIRNLPDPYTPPATGIAETNLLVNGGFEEPVITSSLGYVQGSGARPTGWTLNNTSVGNALAKYGSAWRTTTADKVEGDQVFALTWNGTNYADIQQTFAAPFAGLYRLTFWAGRRENRSEKEGELRMLVFLDGKQIGLHVNCADHRGDRDAMRQFSLQLPPLAAGDHTIRFRLDDNVTTDRSVILDDVRVFPRTFRERETKQYATTFGPDYRGAVAVAASWCGGQGDSDVGNPNGWFCVNSLGERVHVLPTKDTAVTVSGTALPSIPPGTKFACKSFTIDGWAVADSANVDLRGVRIVDVDDNARIITRNGHGIAVNAIRANRIRLDGNLAVVGGIKATGNLEMREGSSLRFPANPDMTLVKSISVRGKDPVVLKPGAPAKRGSFQKILRIEEMPADLTRFRLNAGSDEKAATFSAAPGGKYLGVTPYR